MFFLSIFDPTSVKEVILSILGGLGIFLFGINLMSSSLKNLAGNKLKVLIEKATGTPIKGIVTGIVVTVLIQSSSATTVIVIGLVSAGLMSLPQSIGVMMGANIGTTVTSFLIGLKVADYSFVFIAVGAILALFFMKRKYNLIGTSILGFGLLFAGLELVGVGLKDMKNEEWFQVAMTSLSQFPILGVVTGTALTFIIQSSSGSIGILQQLYHGGSIPLNAALPILLGCNIGTTITALLASLSGTNESKQAAVFNISFNAFGAILFLIVLTPYIALVAYIENTFVFLETFDRLTIAFAHIIFNFGTTLATLIVLKYMVILLKKLFPQQKDKKFLLLVDKLNEDLLYTSPVLALENVKVCINEMGKKAHRMLQLSQQYLHNNNEQFFEECFNIEDEVDYYDHKIHEYLMKMQTLNLSEESSIKQVVYLDTIRDFERIGDHSLNLIEFINNRYSLNCGTNKEMINDLNEFFDKIDTQVTNTLESFKDDSKKQANSVLILEQEIDTLEKKYRRAQLNRITCQTAYCSEDVHLVDMLSNLERISDHCCNIVENILDPHHFNKIKPTTTYKPSSSK